MRIPTLSLILISFFILTFSINNYADDEYYNDPSSQEDYSSQGYYGDAEDAFREPNDNNDSYRERPSEHRSIARSEEYYDSSMPARITVTGEKVIIVNPNTHAWGAYSDKGELLHSGLATAGSRWCSDIGRPCKTTAGTFRIKSLGSEDCISNTYPVGEGGAPMPYCMFFNGGQGLHGSNEVVAGNVSHGCVRLHESDARWIRYHFATVGTKVIIKPY